MLLRTPYSSTPQCSVLSTLQDSRWLGPLCVEVKKVPLKADKSAGTRTRSFRINDPRFEQSNCGDAEMILLLRLTLSGAPITMRGEIAAKLLVLDDDDDQL